MVAQSQGLHIPRIIGKKKNTRKSQESSERVGILPYTTRLVINIYIFKDPMISRRSILLANCENDSHSYEEYVYSTVIPVLSLIESIY